MQKIQLSIPEPCHENWDNMTPTEQGRFCNACAKQVIDFSRMSDEELLNYFMHAKNEKVCGHVWTDQLNRSMATKPVKKKWLGYWHYLVALLLFTGKAQRSKAQGAVVYNTADTSYQTVVLTVEKKTKSAKRIVNGFIKDEKGKPVPYASIRLLPGGKGSFADENGKFSITVKSKDSSIEASALGHTTTSRIAITETDSPVTITLTTDVPLLKEVVVNSGMAQGNLKCTVVGTIGYRRIRKRNFVSDTINAAKNIFKPVLKIYPSPVPAGNSISISGAFKSGGNYFIAVNDAAGQLLLLQPFAAIDKNAVASIATKGHWSKGIYFVKLMDDKRKLLVTASFMIQ